MSPVDRFLAKVEKTEGCWHWKGAKHSSIGYGSFGFKNKITKAHRASFELFKGSIPEKSHVLHRCDNRMCVNPDHLFLGTHRDNMKDRNAKNRQAKLKGELNGRSRLLEFQVLEIRSLYSTNNFSLSGLAKIYSVSKKLILNIVHRRAWKHV